MSYFDAELKAVVPFVVLGAIIGAISFYINQTVMSFIIMLIVAVLGKIIVSKATKIKEPWKWWVSNGIIVYFFTWLVVWTIMFNTMVL